MNNNIKAIDFFCGCGGTSMGLKKSGIEVLRGIDFDQSCAQVYNSNIGKNKFLHSDINLLPPKDLLKDLKINKTDKLLFSACAPCQPFSKHVKDSSGDRRKSLLLRFFVFIKELKPDYIFIENVPGLQNVNKGDVFKKFISKIKSEGYNFKYEIVNFADYGIPQNRQRLILIATKKGEVDFPQVTHGNKPKLKPYKTVREAIANLPPLKAGMKSDLNAHFARLITDKNMIRVKSTPKNGGDRSSWPKHLVLDCHKKSNGHKDVYGRMFWDKPSPALTCKCTSISNGRYGHPDQDRAITPREAACIQTFPRSFKFYGGMDMMSRHIGNAVPVQLAKVFGKQFIKHASTSL